jgi:beta-N-acetylglucosaminidase
VRVTYGEKTVTGYIMMTYITVSVTPGESEEETEEEEEVEEKPTDDVAFETLIAKFPADYRTKLRALHEKHPNWKFVAVQTGLNWSDVIQNESIVGRNTIQSNYPKGGNTLAPFSYLSTESGAYNWANDTYIVKDGTNFYSASSQVISYYMDPRNFLNEDDIFQFEALAYDSSQKVSVVQSILSNTFMKGNYRVVDSATGKIATGSYKQAFMDAGKQSKSSPYFLASRVKQEVGVNGSNSTSGTYGAYAGIYNFYNIGAFDGGDAVAKGLQWAKGGASGATTYGRPWTTPYKSIVGGAQYIAKNYINKGQNTLYFQKFNVNPVNNSNLYLHQYMTAVQAPSLEGRSTKNAYNSLGILDDVMVFYIPVYNNMPAKACALPPATGNPNPYIRYTNLYNGTTKLTGLTPTFRYDRHEYTMVVPANVSSITFTAYAVSSRASITGAGTYTLKSAGQTTTIKLMGIAENGTRQVYTFKITRSAQ